jgi:transmembrane sensor
LENHEQSLTQLYQDFLAGRISPEQALELKKLFGSEDESTLRELVAEALNNPDSKSNSIIDEQKRLDSIYTKVKFEIAQEDKKQRIGRQFGLYTIVFVAAISLAVMGTLLYLNRSKSVQQQTITAFSDVLPGSNKAMLVLSDGRKVSLTEAADGMIDQRIDGVVSKTRDGQLVYTSTSNNQAPLKYNTVATPNGGQYQVVLPDGTKVWLNAASSLTYPVSFGASKERRVELVGEAYFEVAHNKAQPFRVATAGQTVEVLGTHFNVNSYANEKKTTTTLEQGSVKVISGDQVRLIKPGEETLLYPNGKIELKQADLQTTLAWKEGRILFRDADIQTIMRQVSRWYDLEIIYSGTMPERKFNGGVARTANLSSLLKILELNDIRFKLLSEGGKKKLIVEP